VSRLLVKVGGSVTRGAPAHLLDLVAAGNEICVVHGAGPQISAELRRRRLPVEFVGGRRVTSAAALEVVRGSLAAVNRELCAAIGPRATGLLGDEVGLEATPLPELGLVGEPLPTRPPAVEEALVLGQIPVVAPLARGPLNVNADEMAAALAVGLGADQLLFVTDVPGLLLGGAVVDAIGAGEADRLLAEEALEGGIVPKLRAAAAAARLGVRAEIGETTVVA
jgi:acetylglutamate kinase